MLEFLEGLKGRETFLLLSEPSIDLTQDIIVLGGRWIDRDSVAQSLGRLVPLATGLVSPPHLVITQIALRIELDCLPSILKGRLWFTQPIVISTHVDVGGVELEPFSVSDLHRLLVGFKRRCVVA